MKRLMIGTLALGLFATGCGAGGARGVTETEEPSGGPESSSPMSESPSMMSPSMTASPSESPTMVVPSPAKLDLGETKYGKVLVGGTGHTLYLFEKDKKKDKSTCTGECAKKWPPFVTQGAPEAGTGVTKSLVGTFKREDGTTQVSYAGHPLYYYYKDTAPGEAYGQGVEGSGGKWYVVGADGKKIEKS